MREMEGNLRGIKVKDRAGNSLIAHSLIAQSLMAHSLISLNQMSDF